MTRCRRWTRAQQAPAYQVPKGNAASQQDCDPDHSLVAPYLKGLAYLVQLWNRTVSLPGDTHSFDRSHIASESTEDHLDDEGTQAQSAEALAGTGEA